MLYTIYKKGEKAAVLFLLFVLSACSGKQLDKPYPGVNELNTGEKFVVILKENHNEKGYWKLKESNIKSTLHISSVWHGNEKGVYFNFKALGAGTDTLVFTKISQGDTLEHARFIVSVKE